MAEADTSPPWLASTMDERSRGNEGSDKGGGSSRPSPSHSRVSSPAGTPRSTASGVVNLLESERRLLQNQRTFTCTSARLKCAMQYYMKTKLKISNANSHKRFKGEATLSESSTRPKTAASALSLDPRPWLQVG